ncbi:MAG: septal ring lytic transglycosylase RlpA family protein [Rhodospirillales bacterium]|nr:septal ring lytic transglycosylase RlpA family protein [Rhodospirillales bacterium]
MMYNNVAMWLSLVSFPSNSAKSVHAIGSVLVVGCLVVGLAACGSTSGGKGGVAQRGTYKVGAPYKIDGVWYTPKEEFSHVETGVASWYGPGFHGKSTANGERYDQSDRTAAHRTLQMPSIVRVTNLSNGQSTVVRINDRGPFASSRVIDLSRTAAESLAVKDVAINGGGPTEQNAALAQLASGRRAPQQPQQVMATAQPAAAPPATQVQAGWPSNPRNSAVTQEPAPAPSAKGGPTIATLASASPAASGGGFYVQTGSFSTAENAERQRGAVRSYGSSEISQASASGRDVYRVRLGPYTTSDAAGIVADRLKRSGYGDARVVVD